MRVFSVLLFLVINEVVNEAKAEGIESFLLELSKECPLDFKVIVTGSSRHEDGSPKYVDTLVFTSDHNSAANFKLNSLGPKRIEHLQKRCEDKGLAISLFHENYNKNNTKNYGTPSLSEVSAPAAEVIHNKEGIAAGILEALVDTLYETTNDAIIEGLERYSNGKLKKETILTLHAKEVIVKESKDFSSKMLEDGKKLIKRAFKIETQDRANVIAQLFNEKFPLYSWEVYINPITYTQKSEVMAKFKYDNVNYVVVGTS